MQLGLHRSDREFDSLRPEWNPLVEASLANLPFLRHEYLRPWWEMRGGGEWQNASLRLVTGRQERALRAVAPFFQTTYEGRLVLMLLGSIEISDYLDLIAAPEAHAEFCEQLLPFLEHALADEKWEALDLYNLRAQSRTLEALSTSAQALGWAIEKTQLQACPVIRLPTSWEAYLEGLEKRQRHEIRRKLRRAEGDDMEFNWYRVDDSRDLEAETEAFLDLMAADERKAAFLTEAMRPQFRSTVRAASEAGWLQMAFLEVDGQKAAGFLNFDYQNRIWLYNSGMSPRFAALSPGWILLGHLLRWAIENRREAFDFMRGNETYKFQWGGVSEPIYRLRLVRPGR